MTPNELYKALDELGWDWECCDMYEGLRVISIVVDGVADDDEVMDEVYDRQKLEDLYLAWFISDFMEANSGKDAPIVVDKFAIYDALYAYRDAIDEENYQEYDQ